LEDEALITKKELLSLTGISYGALYRWKRKQLIPDAWFIHRSTYTGQETFFPREKVLERVAFIQAHKDTHSLDEIAAMLRPTPRRDSYDASAILSTQLLPAEQLMPLLTLCGYTLPVTYPQLLRMYLVAQIAQHTELPLKAALPGADLLMPLLSEGEWVLCCAVSGGRALFAVLEQDRPIRVAGYTALHTLHITPWIHLFERSLPHE